MGRGKYFWIAVICTCWNECQWSAVAEWLRQCYYCSNFLLGQCFILEYLLNAVLENYVPSPSSIYQDLISFLQVSFHVGAVSTITFQSFFNFWVAKKLASLDLVNRVRSRCAVIFPTSCHKRLYISSVPSTKIKGYNRFTFEMIL